MGLGTNNLLTVWHRVLIYTHLFDDVLVALMVVAAGELAGVVRASIPVELLAVEATRTDCSLVPPVFKATE